MYLHLGITTQAPRSTSAPPAPITRIPLRRVLDTASDPYRCICRIHVRTSKGGNSFGTGVLVSRYHVLTCAHVLFPRENPDPREITVLPGQQGSQDKRPRIKSNGWAVSPGWRWSDCRTDTQDLAIIRLAQPADRFWPVRPFDASIFTWSAAAHLAGYPSLLADPRAQDMYDSRGRIIGRIQVNSCVNPAPGRKGFLSGTLFRDISDTTQLIAHDLDSRKSMSGGPMWLFAEGKRVLFALHAGDIDNGARKKAVYLNSAVQARIADWMTRTLPPLSK